MLTKRYLLMRATLGLIPPSRSLKPKTRQNLNATQANFQLIVITHDEAFVEMLGRSENAHSYFRVSKAYDANGVPYSQIEELPIEKFG